MITIVYDFTSTTQIIFSPLFFISFHAKPIQFNLNSCFSTFNQFSFSRTSVIQRFTSCISNHFLPLKHLQKNRKNNQITCYNFRVHVYSYHFITHIIPDFVATPHSDKFLPVYKIGVFLYQIHSCFKRQSIITEARHHMTSFFFLFRLYNFFPHLSFNQSFFSQIQSNAYSFFSKTNINSDANCEKHIEM